MKFTLSWLKEYLDTNATIDEISEKLTAIGLEVEEIIDHSANLKDFKVAKITEAEPHPNADKLRICKVDTGSEVLQIVCGAPNARAGIKVILANIGVIIPTNGMKIRASKIRDVESKGMLCSADEIGIGGDAAGIVELSEDAILGEEFAGYLGLNDPMIEIAITPNRGDCLGVYGIARDLAATGIGTFKPLQTENIPSNDEFPVDIQIHNEQLCPMLVGRYIKDVKNCESPEWLKQRLESIGLEPISALVDITNYISFAFGRPLHVYDAWKLHDDITIRNSFAGEKFLALNDKEYTLDNDTLVVADNQGAVAIAGIIGGKASGCELETTNVFLEVALFNAIDVAKSGRKLQIDTDSRFRFERNVDPEFLIDAAHLATKLIIDICGGKASKLKIVGGQPAGNKAIEFSLSKVKTLGGVELEDTKIIGIFQKLGFAVEGNGATRQITAPSWRSDIECPAHLVEEILRIYGYDNIPNAPLPNSEPNNNPLPITQKRISDARRLLASRGYKESITWSFMSSKIAADFGGNKEVLKIVNPISSDLDEMRPSIIPNLIEAAQRNSARGYKNLALFESGPVFEDATPKGRKSVIAGIKIGENSPRNNFSKERNFDAYDAKADALIALEIMGSPVDNLRVTTDAPDYYHPGRSGVLRLGKNPLGYFGEIHPAILQKFDIADTIVAFELFLENIPNAKAKKTTARSKLEISDYQAVERDFAFIVDENTAVGEILKGIKSADKKLISDVKLFDIYQGKGVDEGKKSIALSITLTPMDKTLTDDEIKSVSDKIVATVAKNYGGKLRG